VVVKMEDVPWLSRWRVRRYFNCDRPVELAVTDEAVRRGDHAAVRTPNASEKDCSPLELTPSGRS